MKLLTVDDVEIRYEHAPRPGAPALLLLNSLGTSLEMWDDQAQPLSEHYELIRYDARGHGKSGVGSKQTLTIDDLARDALAVLDACGVARTHLCGLSLGGMTAMHIASRWPDRVLKVVLSNTSPYMPTRETWNTRIQTALGQGMSALVDAILERWFTPEFRAAQPDKVERIRAMLLACDPRGYAACSAAIRDMDQRESIRSITAKTLVIAGTRDPATPLTEAELIARSIADAKLTTLEAAHLSNIERADEYTATLLDFYAASAGVPAS
jgi:3-oxoadipate enol-lactonase